MFRDLLAIHRDAPRQRRHFGPVVVLGSLFKSRRFQRDETELVIVVTPYLVRPMNAADVRLPTDGYRNPTTVQGTLMQQSADGVSGASAPKPSIAPSAPPADPANGVSPQASAAPVPSQRQDARKDKRSASADAISPGFTF